MSDPLFVDRFVLEVIAYAVVIGFGAAAGFCRWWTTKSQFSFRVMTASMLMSSLLGFATIAGFWGPKVVENFWGCMGITVAIGLVQPNAMSILSALLQSKGLKLGNDS